MKRILIALAALVVLATDGVGQSSPQASPKILIIGGGAFHDYNRWFNKEDSATLREAGFTSIEYTESSTNAAKELAGADVAVLSANTAHFDTPEYRKALIDFANAGKGLVFIHSGVWDNWPWPDYQQGLVGGGARSHDGPSPFTEHVVKDHPVTQGLPATFQVVDELYHFMPEGTPIEVLVEAGPQKYPSVWITRHAKARIVCIALGHDGRSHTQGEYKKILCNAVGWVAGR